MQKDKKLPLSIDVGTQLKVEVSGFEGRYKCNLIGIKPDEFVIIEAPPPNVSKQLQEGAQIIVRYLYFGDIFGFKSKAMRFISTPFNLLFMSYPDTVERYNLRKDTRIQCNIPAKASIQGKEVRGVIVDISVSGCLYVINAPNMDASKSVNIEEEVTISFPFFGMASSLAVSSKIHHMNCEGSNMFLGLKFDELDSKVLNAIKNYIDDVSY